MKRKLAFLSLLTFLTFGLAGCDLLSMIFGNMTTTVTTTVETTDTSASVETTTIETTTGGTTTTGSGTTTTVGTFSVTFVDHDGTVLKTESVASGGNATPPADPTRPATAQFTYAFSGWSGSYTNVTSNAMVLATYTSTVRSYTVTFYDADGTTILKTETVAYGSGATAPASPTKAATAQFTYAFSGWDVAFTNVTGPLTVKAMYTETLRSYAVTFLDADGTVLKTETVAYGSGATAPADPTKAATAQYTYTFAGWSTSFANITGALAVTAQYTQALRSYAVTFYDADGTTILKTETVAYGSGATAPADPTKAATAQYTYAFSGWSASFATITGALAVTAQYTQTLRSYTVTFFDADGTTILKTETVAYGSGATAPANPTKPATAQYTYAFSGWDGEFANITGPLAIKAMYTETLRTYAVTFVDADGTILKTETVAYGAGATAPADPSRGATATSTFTFEGWDVAFDAIAGPLVVHATYTEHRSFYTVAFYDVDGSLLDRQYVAPGEDAVPPADPVRPATAQYTYTFSGWDGDFAAVDSDREVFASYDVTTNVYTVRFYDQDGTTLLGTVEVDYGMPAEPPEAPAKEGLFFLGWDHGLAFVTHDMDVVATYSDTDPTLWDRQLLLDYILGWHGDETPSPDQLEAEVDMLLQALGTTSEFEAWRMTQVFERFRGDLMLAESLPDLQEAYTNAKASGFDRERIIGILMTTIEFGLEGAVSNGRVEQLQAQIAMLEQMIADTEAMKPLVVQQGLDFCAALPDGYALPPGAAADACGTAWLILIEEDDRYTAYVAAHDNAWDIFGDAWDWSTYNNLEWNLETYYHYLYVEVNSYQAGLYQDAFLTIYNGLTPSQQTMYDGVLNLYSLWKNYAMTDGDIARQLTNVLDDGAGGSVLDRLMDLRGTYEDLFWNLRSYRWHIVELTWQLEDALRERAFLLAVQAWFQTDEGHAAAETLAVTVYDILESVLYGIDEGTFNLIVGLATGTIDPTTLAMDPTAVLNIIDRSTDLLRLFASTVDGGDIENAKTVAKDLLALFIAAQDLDPDQETFLLGILDGVVDDYAVMAEDVFGELLKVLDSLDEQKVAELLNQIMNLTGDGGIVTVTGSKPEGGFDFRMAIAVARIVDILVNDSGLDVDTLVADFVRIYYDVNNRFLYDDAERLAVTEALSASVARILVLAGHVASLDPMQMPMPADLQAFLELQIRIQTIAEAFGGGCPTILLDADYAIYDHQMFLDLVHRMGSGNMGVAEAEAMVDMFVATFETTEQDTYFLLVAVMNVVQNFKYYPSITSVHDLVLGLAGIGYDNPAIAHYLTNLAVNMVAFKLVYTDALHQIDNYQAMIDEYVGYIIALQGDADALRAAVALEISLQPDADVRAAASAFFEVTLELNQYQMFYDRAYNEVRYADEYYYVWNDGVYETLRWARDREIYYGAPLYYDEIGLGLAMADFAAAWDSLTPELQSMYGAVLNVYMLYASFRYGTADPVKATLWSFDPTPYTSDGWYDLASYLSYRAYDLNELEREIAWKQDQIDDWTAQIASLEGATDEGLLAFQGFLTDPENRALIETALGILLDEATHLLDIADTETLDLFLGVALRFRCPCELDMSAAGILGYTQELSTLLKAIGSTITSEELDTLMDLGIRGLTFALTQSDMTPDEQAQILAMIEGFATKYLAVAAITRDDITAFLDSLTEAKIQVVLDQLAILGLGFGRPTLLTEDGTGTGSEGPSQIAIAIAVAKIVDVLLYDGSLDTDSLITTMIEVYYDFAVGGPYDPAVKAQVVAAFQEQIDQFILLAHELAAVDPALLTPAALALLTEARQRGQFLMDVLQSGRLENILLAPVSFGYERWMFLQFLFNFDPKTDWNDPNVAEATIATITEVLDVDEEEAYYDIVAILNLAQNAIASGDPQEILAALANLEAIGFTDADLAAWLGNLPLAALTYQQFMSDYYGVEGNPYEADLYSAEMNLQYLLDLYQGNLDEADANVAYWQERLDELEAKAALNIALVNDGTSRAAAQTLWDTLTQNDRDYLAYYWAKEMVDVQPEWDEGLFYALQNDLEFAIFYVSVSADEGGVYDPTTAMNYRNDYDSAFASLTIDQQALYGPILALFEIAYTANVNEVTTASIAFWDRFYNGPIEDQTAMAEVADAKAAYWYILDSLHDAEMYLATVPGLYEASIQEAEAWLATVQDLYDSYQPADLSPYIAFFANPTNAANWDVFAAALVEEAGNLLSNITPELLDLVVSFIRYQDVNAQLRDSVGRYQELLAAPSLVSGEVALALASIPDPVTVDIANAWWLANAHYADSYFYYRTTLDAAWYEPGFDPSVYFYLENLLANALQYEGENDHDDALAIYYRNWFNTEVSTLTPQELLLYGPVFASYESCTAFYFGEYSLAANTFFYHYAVIWDGVNYGDYDYWSNVQFWYDQVNVLSSRYYGSVEDLYDYAWLPGKIDELQAEAASLLDLSPEGIAGYAHLAAAFLDGAFATIDATDYDAIVNLLYAGLELHLQLAGYDEPTIADLMLEVDGVFEFYLDAVLAAPAMAASLLNGLSGADIQTIMGAIATIDALDGVDPDLDNMVRAVAIATIIVTVYGDGFDTDYVVAVATALYFDVTSHFHYDGPIDILARTEYLAALVDDIILHADAIDAFDPYALTDEERNAINDFHLLVEELMPYLAEGLDYEPIS